MREVKIIVILKLYEITQLNLSLYISSKQIFLQLTVMNITLNAFTALHVLLLGLMPTAT